MDNEKSIVYTYNNVERKIWGKRDEPPQTTPKQKIMLCIWLDWKGIVYYELLPRNQTIDSNKCCSQLYCLKAAIDEKRPELNNHYIWCHIPSR
jgi:[histone H3]-lysine36 N-dimethyltransferase SETMAR